jgi:hypothetical protein
MTTPAGWADEGDEYYGEDVATALEPPVVPVRVVHTDEKRIPPEFCSMNSYTIAQIGQNQPTQVLTRAYERFKAKFYLYFPGAGTVWFNTKQEPLTNPSPSGFPYTVTAAGILVPHEYEAMQPLWCISTIAAVTVAVMDQRYGKVA